ncbi:MAG: GNAT family N-acetyltransferase, partial [Deltaproteobacteria bacterium]|nr:GNAT family N-acetyltransferase [Deltaproteobacteria bacterium]
HRRRRGVGRALLAEALRRAREEGAGAAWLEVRPSNTDALKLYESFGFMEVGVRPKYYGDNQEDALVLFLALD